MTFLFLRMMTIVNWCYSEGKIFFGKVFTALGNHMYFWQCLQTSLVGSIQYMPRSERSHEKTAHFPVPIPRLSKLGKANSIIWPDCRNNWCLIGSILQNCQGCSGTHSSSTKRDLLSLTPHLLTIHQPTYRSLFRVILGGSRLGFSIDSIWGQRRK